MKRILIIIAMLWGVAHAQTIGYLRYDTVKIYTTKVGGRGSLDVTGNVKFTGLLPKSAGTDSVVVRDASGNLGTTAKSAFGGTNIYNSDGTLTGARTVTLSTNDLQFYSATDRLLIKTLPFEVQSPTTNNTRMYVDDTFTSFSSPNTLRYGRFYNDSINIYGALSSPTSARDLMMVVDTLTGKLGQRAIPTGAITGSGTSGQMTYWNGTSSITGNTGALYNGTALTLTADATISTLTIGRGLGGTVSNTALGNITLAANTTGTLNTAVGQAALNVHRVGSFNTAVGALALLNDTSGLQNTAIGSQTLTLNLSGYRNTAVGDAALYNNTTGFNNTAIGAETMVQNLTGSYNTAVGRYSLISNTSGTFNTGIGNSSLELNTQGDFNTGLGNYALNDVTIGDNNIGIGHFAGDGIVTGSANTIIGANITGLAAGLTNHIMLANGTGAVKAMHDGTDWTLTGKLNTTDIINATTGYQIGGAATSRKILVGNGTNFVPSTETYAVPGTTGNVLTSDGTNWTSAAPSAGSGTVNSGSQYRIAYYATAGTAVSEAPAITASRALISDANGVPTHSAVTATTLAFLDATSSVQTQIDGKWSLASGGTLTGTNTITAAANPLILSTGVTTGTGATAGFQVAANSLTTGIGIDESSSSLTTGSIHKITSTSTVVNAGSLLSIAATGVNSTTGKTVTGAAISVTNSNVTSGTNIGLDINVSGAITDNIALRLNSAISGLAQVKVMSANETVSTGPVNIAHFNTGQIAARTTMLFSNSGTSSEWANNYAVLAVNGASYATNSYFTNISGKTTDGGYSYFISGGSAVTGMGLGTATNTPLYLGSNNSAQVRVGSASTGILQPTYFGSISTVATAKIHIAAGSTPASSAPLKFTSGPLNTTAEVGAVEFLTDKYYATITTGAARKELTLNDAALTSGTVPVATTNGRLTNGLIISSGTYTPTLTNVTNITASTAYDCQYLRVGNTVTVSGKVDIDVTLGAASELGMSLPVASAMTAEENLGGTASSPAAASLVSAVKADATNDRAAFVFTAISLTNDSYFFEFTYQIK